MPRCASVHRARPACAAPPVPSLQGVRVDARMVMSCDAAPALRADRGGRRRPAGAPAAGGRRRRLVAHLDGRRRPAGARAQPPAPRAAPERRPLEGRRDHGGAQAQPGPDVDQRELSGVLRRASCTWDNFANNQNFVESVSYLFERGGKREKRTLVAQDTTDVGVEDGGRRRAAAGVPDRAGVHQRAARELDARSRAREPEELLERAST